VRKKLKIIKDWWRGILSGTVHTRVEVHRIGSEMSGLVE